MILAERVILQIDELFDHTEILEVKILKTAEYFKDFSDQITDPPSAEKGLQHLRRILGDRYIDISSTNNEDQKGFSPHDFLLDLYVSRGELRDLSKLGIGKFVEGSLEGNIHAVLHDGWTFNREKGWAFLIPGRSLSRLKQVLQTYSVKLS